MAQFYYFRMNLDNKKKKCIYIYVKFWNFFEFVEWGFFLVNFLYMYNNNQWYKQEEYNRWFYKVSQIMITSNKIIKQYILLFYKFLILQNCKI